MSIKARLRMVRLVLRGFSEEEADPDPIAQFKRWYADAEQAGLYLPESMAVATATPDGRPSVRMMLLKGVDSRGFVFFTNYESRKGGELAENPRVALVFHWNELQRQVRVEGPVERTSAEESDAYFQSRLRGSRIGAWASAQSRTLNSRKELMGRVKEMVARFKGGKIPLPPFWGGVRLAPESIEFWQGRADRLHDRILYRRSAGGWLISRLSP